MSEVEGKLMYNLKIIVDFDMGLNIRSNLSSKSIQLLRHGLSGRRSENLLEHSKAFYLKAKDLGLFVLFAFHRHHPIYQEKFPISPGGFPK